MPPVGFPINPITLPIDTPTVTDPYSVQTLRGDGSVALEMTSGRRFGYVGTDWVRVEDVIMLGGALGAPGGDIVDLDQTIGIDAAGVYQATLRPVFIFDSAPLVRHFSDLSAGQRSATNLQWSTLLGTDSTKWGMSLQRIAGLIAVGFELIDSTSPVAAIDNFAASSGPRSAFPGVASWLLDDFRLDFSDLYDTGFPVSRRSGKIGLAFVVDVTSVALGDIIVLDPTITFTGETADNSTFTIDSGGSYDIDIVNSTSVFSTITEDGSEEWRAHLGFNTGATIPAGSTITAAQLSVRLATIFYGGGPGLVLTPRVDIAMAKAQDAWGAVVEPGDHGWISAQVVLALEEITDTIGYKIFTIPSGDLSTIATVADVDVIVPIDPNQNGWTEFGIRERTLFTGPGWFRVDREWNAANSSPSRRPKLDVTYTPPPGSTAKFAGRLSFYMPHMPGF